MTSRRNRNSTVANTGPRSNNDGSSPSSGIKMEDATSVSQFIELLAAFTEDTRKQGMATDREIMTSFLMLRCFKNCYTLPEFVEELKSHGIEPNVTERLHAMLLSHMKPTVKDEYNKLSRLAAEERISRPQRQLEDASSVREFLDLLAAQIQKSNETVACKKVFLQCVQRYLTLEETVGELSKYMDQNQAYILIYSYMTKMRTSVKEEYRRLCSIAAQVAPLLVTSHSTSSTVASASVVTSAQPCELQDALTARAFIGILAGQIQQKVESVAPLEIFFKCLDGFSSSEETLEKLSQYMDQRQATELYGSTMKKMKKEVRADYQSLCQLKCDRERSVQRQRKLEDAFTLAEFLETLARDNQLKRNTTAYEEVLLKCFQHYSASEKMADELKQKNLDATEANILYHQILRKMNIKVRVEYQKLVLASAHNEGLQEDSQNEIVPPLLPDSNLEDAESALQFLQILKFQVQQNKEQTAIQEVLLKHFQGYSTLEQTTQELQTYYNMDEIEATTLYQRIMEKMKREVKEDYQKLCLARALPPEQENQQVPSDIPQDSDMPPMFTVVASTSSNDQTGSLSQPTDSIHQILVTMNETMKQMVDSNKKLDEKVQTTMHQMMENSNKLTETVNKLDEKMQKTVQQMRELYNSSQKNLQTSLTEFLNTEFDPKFRKTINERFAIIGPAIGKKAFSDVGKAVSQQLDEQKQKTVQQMRELYNSSQKNLQTSLTEFLNTEFDPKFRKAINERFAALGPEIGKKAFSDVGKAVSQLEESFSSKIKESNKSISEQLSQLESALSAAQSLTHELADSQKDRPSKILTSVQNLQDLSQLISEGKYEESFSWALDCNDASTVSWLCSQVNMDNLPLSQRVCCRLLRELTTNLKKNTSDKLKWIGHIISSIKAGVTTTQEVSQCFDLVNQRLRWYIKEINFDKYDAVGLLPSLAL